MTEPRDYSHLPEETPLDQAVQIELEETDRYGGAGGGGGDLDVAEGDGD